MKTIPPLIFALLLLFTTQTIAQEESEVNQKRVELTGTIQNTLSEPLEGIVIFNESTMRGTVTNEAGVFRIDVMVDDFLSIKALNFQPFQLRVTPKVVETQKTVITVNEGVTPLEEVRITDLTGELELDLARIKTVNTGVNTLSAKELQNPRNDADNYYRDIDLQGDDYPIRNSAMQENDMMINVNGDLLGLAALLVGTIVDATNLNFSRLPRAESRENFDVAMVKSKYNTEYLVNFLDIKEENLFEFLYFASDRGLDKQMLQPENELELLQFLQDQVDIYKKRQKEGTQKG